MIGYCPNCGRPVEHDGTDASCDHCKIDWRGGASQSLKPEPYTPGELEAIHAEATRRFEAEHADIPGFP